MRGSAVVYLCKIVQTTRFKTPLTAREFTHIWGSLCRLCSIIYTWMRLVFNDLEWCLISTRFWNDIRSQNSYITLAFGTTPWLSRRHFLQNIIAIKTIQTNRYNLQFYFFLVLSNNIVNIHHPKRCCIVPYDGNITCLCNSLMVNI